MYIFLPKQERELEGKRKIATIVSAVLFFLSVVAGGFVGYSLVFGTPSLSILLLIFLGGVILGSYHGVKLYSLQPKNVETYQLLDRIEKVRNGALRVADGERKD